MLNFTVGPVQMDEEIRRIGYEQVPYFRTEEFSKLMLENEKLIKKFAKAEENARVAFITGSGTASMEATVVNLFNEEDNLLVVNGGSFGKRFVELCKLYNLKHTEIKLDFGEELTQEILDRYANQDFTGFLVNINETSTGMYYNIDIISEFCKKHNIFLVVDAISSFLADPVDMVKYNIGVMITGSQKALACPPGVSIIVLSEEAQKRVYNNDVRCMYLNLKSALENGERGQTPFTPAVGILIQINKRLKMIDENGGVDAEIKRVAEIAEDFRSKIRTLPLKVFSSSLSNAVTPICPINVTPSSVFNILKNEYNIWVCPNGGDLKDKIFRVGHIGALTKEDNDVLINALIDMQKRDLL